MSLSQAREVLRATFGYSAFRPLQAQVVRHVLSGRDVLAVLPTGGGKSLCFQVPALVSSGLTIVISPLIALMQDQVAALMRRGVAAAAVNSSLDIAQQRAVIADAASGSLRLLYVSPERLPRLIDELRTATVRVDRLAVDEAHCIVEWGHDFRPSYRALRRARAAMDGPACVALTASATPAVRQEIHSALGLRRNTVEVIGSFDRPNLRFEVIPVVSRDDRLARLVVMVRTQRGAAIVYAPTRGLVEALTRVLVESGVSAAPYHAGMQADERREVLEGFLADRCRVVVATCAFGMGIDKPGVRLVVHWSLPATPESYYQEAGRAGRDGAPARCVLLFHPADVALPRRQLEATFPPERVLSQLWQEPLSRSRHPAAVVAAADRLAMELRPDRGRVDWSAVRRRRREAERRLEAIAAYARGTGCRRRVLLEWFGETVTECGGCDRCTHSPPRQRRGWWRQ